MNQTTQEQSPSGLSIAALITGILGLGPSGLGIVSIILGAVDLSRIKKGLSSEKGRGFDIAGIVLGSIGTIIWLIVLIISIVLFSSMWWY